MNDSEQNSHLPKIKDAESRTSNPSKADLEDAKSDPSNIVIGPQTDNSDSKEEEDVDLMESKCIDWSWKNIILTLIFLSLVITAITLFIIYNSEIKDFADDYARFMKDNPVPAVFMYMFVYIITRPIWIPATIFILFGAYIFGEAFGFLGGFFLFVFVDYISLLVGTFLAFLNGRYLFKNCVQNMIQKRRKLMALSEALSHNAKKLVFLLRLCSLTPYYIFNYVWSVTNMSAKDYFIGNLAIILWDAPYIYVWASLSDISEVEDSSGNLGVWYYVIIVLSISIVIVVIILVYYFAKKELAKTLEKIKNENRKNKGDKNNGDQKSHATDKNISAVGDNPYLSYNIPSAAPRNAAVSMASSIRSSNRRDNSIVPVSSEIDEEER